MASLLSPGIQILETNNTNVVPSTGTTVGGVAGAFVWGPALEARLVTSETELVNIFGKPNDITAPWFFTASNFLSYSNALYVIRGIGSATNASSVQTGTFNGTGSQTAFTLSFAPVDISSVTVSVGGVVQASNACTIAGSVLTFTTAPVTGTNNILVKEKQLIKNDDEFSVLTSLPANIYAKYPGVLGNSLKVILADTVTYASLTNGEKALFSNAPENEEIHFAVIDFNGDFTGVAGTLLEKKEFLSKTTGAQSANGEVAYFKEWINRNSSYVRATGFLTQFTSGKASLVNGVSDDALTNSELQAAFDKFLEKEKVDTAIIMTGASDSTVASYVLSNIGAIRKDSIICISPKLSDVLNASGQETSNITTYRTTLGSSSYGFMDSNWKLQYDVYNDVNRWVPINGDIGGIIARSDKQTDPWISPAGYNRGIIKNVIRLAWNPSQAQRDILYNNNINAITTEFGKGSFLFGDKTLLTRPSAFDRINVRRLFIVMEKTIGEAAKFVLFEPNDEFTRASFRNTVTPYLRTIQGSRGISDFQIVCDSTNNTSDIISRNEFAAIIKVKPVTSINFITLNFTATREGVNFDELSA
jgi:hypothetical protein